MRIHRNYTHIRLNHIRWPNQIPEQTGLRFYRFYHPYTLFLGILIDVIPAT